MKTKRIVHRDSTLAKYLDSLQSTGRYTFRREEAQAALQVSETALQASARRLFTKKRLVSPRRGFFVIVPIEYRAAGAPPADWFVDDLMKFHGHPYYVGLLSAASLYGAAHQQPQQMQVVTDVPLRPVKVGRARIRFFTKRHISGTPTTASQTETGSMRVSTPEATALDLVRYVASAGHLSNVATVLAELVEKLDPVRLVQVAKTDVELSHVQRLGYLLDLLGQKRLADPLARWVASQRPRPILLRPGRPARNAKRAERWITVVNEAVEIDR